MPLPFRQPLTVDQQRGAGIDAPWPMAMADQVRFGEIDMLGHVNNAVYFSWFETIRVQYFRDWGLTGTGPDRPRIVLRRAEIDYLAEMRADEVYVLTCRCVAYRTTSFTLEHGLFVGGTQRAAFRSVVVTLTHDGSARRPLPAPLLARFHDIDGVAPGEA